MKVNRSFLIVSILLVCVIGCSMIQKVIPRKPLRPYGFHFDTYVVKEGDSFAELCDAFGIPKGIVSHLNRLHDQQLEVGQTLLFPFYNEVFPTAKQKGFEVDACPPYARRKRGVAWPLIGSEISSAFGMRWGRSHSGIDLRAPEGIPIFAAASGRVTFAGDRGDGYGKLVIVTSSKLEAYYAHQSKIVAQEGDLVEVGDLIGYVGKTGRATGPHLHFETRLLSDGIRRAINPLCFYSPLEESSAPNY